MHTRATVARTYPIDLKQQAIALYAEVGAAEAARQLDIPSGTIKAWAHRNGAQPLHRSKNSEAVRAAVERRQRTAEERRTRLVELLGELAELGVERSLDLVNEADLRDAVGAWTRAIHDLQLLAGGPTSRTETRTIDAIDAELDELAAALRPGS